MTKNKENEELKAKLNKAVDKINELSHTAKTNLKKGKVWLKEHPKTTMTAEVLTAVGLGFLAGYLLGKKKKD